ncbi:hypothetical protein D3C74_501090 [compost metagenome]
MLLAQRGSLVPSARLELRVHQDLQDLLVSLEPQDLLGQRASQALLVFLELQVFLVQQVLQG